MDLGVITNSWQEWASGMLSPVLALAVVVCAMIISYLQGLGLEKEMAISIARAFLQLSVIGFVLEFIFNQSSVGWIILAYLFMVTIAGYTAGRRAKNVPHGQYIAGVSILIGTFGTMLLLVVLKVFPFTPQYIIPVAGMMVGNAMTVTGVTLKRLREDLRQQQGLIETSLALGATPRQAILKQVKRSLIVGLSPVLDSAKTVGLVTLPGAMTGLIMGGASPMEAIQLQIVVQNMLVGAATLSAVLATYLSWPFFFTKTYQLKTKELRAE
jgi:putative ABC transport system permease protein